MHLLSVFLFSVSSNLDNLAIGLSYGMNKVSIRWKANLLIGGITSLGTIGAMALGQNFSAVIPKELSGMLGGMIIVIIGCLGFLSYWEKKKKDEGEGNEELCAALHLKEASAVGCALALNNIGLGIGAGIANFSIVPTSVCSFVCSLAFLYLGNKIGSEGLSKLAGRFAEPAANVIMIFLGIYEIFI